jgi:hypothetical protein
LSYDKRKKILAQKILNMKRKILLQLTPVAALLVLLSSCYKDPLKNLTEDESRIYITNYDTTASFSSYRTFSIADSVASISNRGVLAKSMSSADSQYVNAVANALTQRRFIRVGRNQQPDLGVTVSRINSSYTQIVNYGDYGYYGSYWDPYYWGYPGYGYYFPTYYGVYNVNEEAIAIDIVDLKNAGTSHQLKDVWSALIRGSGIDNLPTIQSQVDQLFNQSPYFRVQ